MRGLYTEWAFRKNHNFTKRRYFVKFPLFSDVAERFSASSTSLQSLRQHRPTETLLRCRAT